MEHLKGDNILYPKLKVQFIFPTLVVLLAHIGVTFSTHKCYF